MGVDKKVCNLFILINFSIVFTLIRLKTKNNF